MMLLEELLWRVKSTRPEVILFIADLPADIGGQYFINQKFILLNRKFYEKAIFDEKAERFVRLIIDHELTHAFMEEARMQTDSMRHSYLFDAELERLFGWTCFDSDDLIDWIKEIKGEVKP